MSNHYNPRAFFDSAPREILQAYFERHQIPVPLGAQPDDLPLNDLMECWNQLPPATRLKPESDFQDIYDLARKGGMVVLMEEALRQGADIVSKFEGDESNLHKVFLAFMDHPDVFDNAKLLHHADHLYSRSWRRRMDVPITMPNTSVEAQKELGKAISDYFFRKQGRGKVCTVNVFERHEHDYYFFSYPEDYTSAALGYDGDDKLEWSFSRLAFEVIYIYHSNDGVLESYAQGNKETKRELEGIFARCILGTELPPETKLSIAYDIAGLASRQFSLPTKPGDGIQEVRIKRLRMDILGRWNDKITFESTGTGHPLSIYDLIEDMLVQSTYSRHIVVPSQATFQVTFHPIGNRKPKKVCFTVTTPDCCTLKDNLEHRILKRLLKEWDIAKG